MPGLGAQRPGRRGRAGRRRHHRGVALPARALAALGAGRNRNRDVNLDIGQTRAGARPGTADGTARVSYRGSAWNVRFRGAGTPAPGEHVIVAVEGNRLRRCAPRAAEPPLPKAAHGNRHRPGRHRRHLRHSQTFKIVPQQNAWVVERLGKYDRTLTPGLKFVVPFIERVAYKHSLKEVPLDVPSQVCITKDNTQLQVDGILYFQVTDPMRASYGSSNYIVAITQLAQTTLRSVIGKMELDKTFEEREQINASRSSTRWTRRR